MKNQITLNRAKLDKFAAFLRKHECENWFIAKDQGAYVGATGGKEEDGTFENCIFYFKGCDPSKGDVWEHCQARFGGDDFGEHLPVNHITALADDPGVISATIIITSDSVRIKVTEKVRKPALN